MIPNVFGKSAFNRQQHTCYQIHDVEGTGEYEQHLKRDYYCVYYLCHGKPPFEAADRICTLLVNKYTPFEAKADQFSCQSEGSMDKLATDISSIIHYTLIIPEEYNEANRDRNNSPLSNERTREARHERQ
jgi:hypothetical protein